MTKERDALQARVMELEALVYVPGSWHCPKCKFTLLQSNLNAHDGTVTARDAPGDKCPNCNGPLWRCTWKNDAFEMQERAVEQMERAKAAESRALRAEQELDAMNDNHRVMARQMADLGRALIKAEQERDEAYERAAKVALAHILEPGLSDNPAYINYQPSDMMARKIAAAIRRLAWPEKEG